MIELAGAAAIAEPLAHPWGPSASARRVQSCSLVARQAALEGSLVEGGSSGGASASA